MSTVVDCSCSRRQGGSVRTVGRQCCEHHRVLGVCTVACLAQSRFTITQARCDDPSRISASSPHVTLNPASPSPRSTLTTHTLLPTPQPSIWSGDCCIEDTSHRNKLTAFKRHAIKRHERRKSMADHTAQASQDGISNATIDFTHHEP